jgi:hypothetical protein
MKWARIYCNEWRLHSSGTVEIDLAGQQPSAQPSNNARSFVSPEDTTPLALTAKSQA